MYIRVQVPESLHSNIDKNGRITSDLLDADKIPGCCSLGPDTDATRSLPLGTKSFF